MRTRERSAFSALAGGPAPRSGSSHSLRHAFRSPLVFCRQGSPPGLAIGPTTNS